MKIKKDDFNPKSEHWAFKYFNEVTNHTKEQLDKLLNKKTMKITEDTKIKDLIPEGMELCGTASDLGYTDYFTLKFKKKEVKDFSWYVKQYLSQTKIIKWEDADNSNSFFDENYSSIPFEIKIGLLKFICDDINCSWMRIVDGSDKDMEPIRNICPKEFLDSIFN